MPLHPSPARSLTRTELLSALNGLCCGVDTSDPQAGEMTAEHLIGFMEELTPLLDTGKADPRSLTSREVAKLLGGTLGALATFTDKKALMDAVDHIVENRKLYLEMWTTINEAESPGDLLRKLGGLDR